MNFIGTTANLGSLPHEIGHAYGLRPSGSWGHTNTVPGFGNNNIMWGGGPGTRNNFTVGQSFRLNTDTTSMLNANGDRAGPTETCLPNVSNTICPALGWIVCPTKSLQEICHENIIYIYSYRGAYFSGDIDQPVFCSL